MSTVLLWLVVNAAQASVLAGLVALVGLCCRRPALMRALWIVVLLKMVTPPLLSLPWSLPGTAAEPPAPVAKPRAEPRAPIDPRLAALLMSGAVPIAEPDSRPVREPAAPVGPRAQTASRWPASAASWTLAALALGSLTILTLAWRRSRRVGTLLSCAEPGDPLLHRSLRDATRRLRSPARFDLRLLRSRMSPFLWPHRRHPTIGFPEGLRGHLDDSQTQLVLAHEVAHHRQGGGWLRRLELLCTALYWWCPTLWWARRRLQDSEELCCDSLVAQNYPNCRQDYARALLAVTDYLSTDPVAAPGSMAAVGSRRFFRRRMEVLLSRNERPGLGWRGRASMLALSAAVLPFTVGPAWADEVLVIKDDGSVQRAPAGSKVVLPKGADAGFEKVGDAELWKMLGTRRIAELDAKDRFVDAWVEFGSDEAEDDEGAAPKRRRAARDFWRAAREAPEAPEAWRRWVGRADEGGEDDEGVRWFFGKVDPESGKGGDFFEGLPEGEYHFEWTTEQPEGEAHFEWSTELPEGFPADFEFHPDMDFGFDEGFPEGAEWKDFFHQMEGLDPESFQLEFAFTENMPEGVDWTEYLPEGFEGLDPRSFQIEFDFPDFDPFGGEGSEPSLEWEFFEGEDCEDQDAEDAEESELEQGEGRWRRFQWRTADGQDPEAWATRWEEFGERLENFDRDTMKEWTERAEQWRERHEDGEGPRWIERWVDDFGGEAEFGFEPPARWRFEEREAEDAEDAEDEASEGEFSGRTRNFFLPRARRAPPEADDLQQRIRELEQQLQALQKALEDRSKKRRLNF